jgi:hypothetical protein
MNHWFGNTAKISSAMSALHEAQLLLAKMTRAEKAGILQAYPTLFAEDLVNAWHYVRAHETAIEEQARSNEEA